MMGPTAAISIIPQLVVPLAGAATPLAFVVAAVAIGAVAVSFVGFSRRIATSGSVTAFVADAFGPLSGFLAGWALTFNYLALVPGCAACFAYFLLLLVGAPHAGLPVWGAIALAALVVAVVASTRDIGAVCRAALVLELFSMTAVVLLALAVAMEAPVTPAAFAPSPPKGLSGLGAGTVLAITSFVGFEGAATLGREAREPLRVIPFAIAAAIGVTGLFFVLTCYAEIAAFGPARVDALEKADGPLALLADRFVAPGAGVLVDAAGALSSFSVLLGLVPASSRMVHTIATEARFPSLARLSGTAGVPARASAFVGTVGLLVGAGIVAAAPAIAPLDLFGIVATIGTLAVILVYMAVALGGMIDAARRRRRLVSLSGLLGLLVLVWPLWSSIYPAPPWPEDLFPPLVLLWLLAGIALFVDRSRRARTKPERVTWDS